MLIESYLIKYAYIEPATYITSIYQHKYMYSHKYDSIKLINPMEANSLFFLGSHGCGRNPQQIKPIKRPKSKLCMINK